MEGGPGELRWRLAEHEESGRLFPESSLGERHVGTGEFRGMEFLHVNARTIVNKVPASSRMPFSYTINAYRGCSHACTYCFARPTHTYLGLGIGEDFECKIVVKVNAVERLRAELRSPRWRGDSIAMGTNTDPYQKAEGKYHLTQGIVGVLAEAGNPFSILTKSTLVLRDLALLADATARTRVRLALSIGTLERDVWQLTEPGAPPPDQRLEALRRLSEAGIRCGVLIAPVLPGLSDSDDQLRAVAQACLEAGAVSVTPVALHLRPGVREHYLGWLARTRPELAELYAQRFRKGSYQPRAEQHHISEVVRAVQEAGGRDYPKHRPSGHEPTGRPREAPPQRVRPVNEQLRLL
ncbi:MAG: radical SAM protein [Acidimicrobiales bacterium]|jgi:DNA repair photolyase